MVLQIKTGKDYYMTRHEMRESAFMLVFERALTGEDVNEIIETAKESEAVPVNDAVLAAFRGVEQNRDQIDACIRPHLKKWTLERITKVSLAALRVAVYEILFVDDIDADISVSEAVKICETYTTKEDTSFVNGVLGSLVRQYREKQKPAEAENIH